MRIYQKSILEVIVYKDEIVLTDLGSRNGTIVNDSRVSQSILENNDKIIIGQSVCKYEEFFNEEPVQENEEEEEEEEEEGSQKKKNQKLIIGAVLLGAIFLFMDDESDPPPKKLAPKFSETADQAKKNITEEVLDEDLKKKFDMYLQKGIREYREENYLRSIHEFEMALTLNPIDGRAAFYKSRAKNKITESLESLFIKATRERDALKYSSALVSLCSVKKLLSNQKDDNREKQANDMIKEIQLSMGMEENENMCFTQQ